jgi:5-methylcytosine-specific restriction endonuclease McrA
MDFYVTSHLSNAALRIELKTSDGAEAKATARMLSRIAEFDERELYREDGYPSMHAYCVGELKYTGSKASKRIYAARAARRFEVLFIALADGRLHLTGLVMLAKYLGPGNLDELLAAASRKTADEIAQLIAERFPRPDLPERLEEIAPPPVAPLAPPQGLQHSARNVDDMFLNTPPCPDPIPAAPPAPAPSQPYSARNTEPPSPPSRMTPLAPQRFGFQFTGDQETRELYDDVQALLSHQIPSGQIALVFKRALQLAKAELEKRKYAATDRPGRSRGSKSARHIPAPVRREVHERDEGRCTFVSESGKRCDSRHMVEFEHDVTRARGGESTPKNLRLLCRAHNQLMAEREFGTEFMERKRGARGRRGPRHSSNVRDANTGEPL